MSPGGRSYFTCKPNMKLVITKFYSGGLHEKHVVATGNVGKVATWNLGKQLGMLGKQLGILGTQVQLQIYTRYNSFAAEVPFIRRS